MTFTWLRLLFAAPLLLSAASSQYVSVKCNDTEEGQLVTIHCTYTLPQNCKFILYQWNNTHGNIECDGDSGKHTCEWDGVSRLSLIISDVRKEENYSVNILTNCGMATSPHIKVQIISPVPVHSIITPTTPGPIETTKTHVPVLLGIFVPVIALGIFGALFGKKIINRINKATPQDNNPDMERAVLHDNKELQELVLKPGNESAFLHFLFPCVRG